MVMSPVAVGDIAATVLVVDDDHFMLSTISTVVNEAGFNVLTARDGAQALEIFASGNVDCIVTDVSMPGMSGFDLCATARILPQGERVQILILTGSDDHESARRAFEAGANDFAMKSVMPEMVVERIRFLLKAQTMQDALRASEERLSHAQRMARLGHWERSLDGHTLAVSPMVMQLLELDARQPLDWAGFLALVHPEDRDALELAVQRAVEAFSVYRVEHRMLTASGHPCVLQHQGEVANGEQGNEWIIRATLQDITERRAQEDRISYLVHHDSLTALPNRESIAQSLHVILREQQKVGGHVAVFALGVDNFAQISSSLGHTIGDMALKTAGDRLRGSIRDHDRVVLDSGGSDGSCLVARGEGARFFCIFPRLALGEVALSIAQRLQKIIAAPMSMGDTLLNLSASVGISMYPDDGEAANQLLDNALIALNHTRSGEKGAVEFFTQEISRRARQRLVLESELRQAIAEGQFELYYQPRITLIDDRVHGAEALIRWHHPQRGLVSPGEFIPLVEEQGLIEPLGNLVIDLAVRQASRWRERFGRQFRLSFNISPLQFVGVDLMQVIDSAVQRHHADYTNLEVEITESALMARADAAVATLHALRERHIKLALDDFGTGFSSLSYLQQLPLDILKIDRSFISDIGVSRNGTSLVNAMLMMARALDMECVAEGVELDTQLAYLREQGCQQVQGYLIARPIPATDFETFVERWQHTRQQAKRA